MRFKTYTGITWSLLELTGLLEDEDSRVYFEKFKKHIGLHPFHMTNLNAALNEILSSNLNAYDHDIQGFLLAYKNPKVLTPLGEVFYDTCFIHVDIEADFYIFRPEVGCMLKGIVNKKGLDHIGLLVHKAFNVSIPKPDDEDDWPGNNVEIGQEVRCVVKLLDFTGKLPFIRGVLNPDEYLRGCRLTPKSVNNKRKNAEELVDKVSEKNAKKHTYCATDSEGNSDDQGTREVVQRKKSKRKLEQEEPVEHGDEPTEKKKKKKRDKKVKEPKESAIQVKQETACNSVNGELMSTEETEESTSSAIEDKKIRVRNSRGSTDTSQSRINEQSKVKTKIKVQSSQSSVDEDNAEGNPTKHSSKKSSKTSSSLDYKGSISKIKLESRTPDIEITEENIVEHKPKIRRGSLDNIIDIDDTQADFTTETHVKSRKTPKKIKKELPSDVEVQSDNVQETPKKRRKKEKLNLEISESSMEQNNIVDIDNTLADFTTETHVKSRKTPKKVKNELSSDVDVQSDNVQETPKKRRKKENLNLEISESEAGRDVEETSVKKRSKKSNGLDFEHTSRTMEIKKERITNSSENIADENVNNRSIEETEETTTPKKKSKKHSRTIPIDTSRIKAEPGFENVIVKVEPNDDYEEEVDDPGNVSKSSSKKRNRNHVADVADSNEVDIENNVEQSRNKTKKKTADETDLNNSDQSFRSPERKKKRHSKSSLNKEESRESESGVVGSSFEFRDVKIKRERSVDK